MNSTFYLFLSKVCRKMCRHGRDRTEKNNKYVMKKKKRFGKFISTWEISFRISNFAKKIDYYSNEKPNTTFTLSAS